MMMMFFAAGFFDPLSGAANAGVMLIATMRRAINIPFFMLDLLCVIFMKADLPQTG
jgi:hypothetical protein